MIILDIKGCSSVQVDVEGESFATRFFELKLETAIHSERSLCVLDRTVGSFYGSEEEGRRD